MLRTNSKKAHQNVQQYIINHFNEEYHDFETPEEFTKVAEIIMKYFEICKPYSNEYIRRSGLTKYEVFRSWCQGLPSGFDVCYYYNRSAVDDLGDILEQTQEERNKYTHAQAEELLTYLIYRELVAAC